MKNKKILAGALMGLCLVAVATFSPKAAEAAYFRDLTIGSTGADVAELQTFLVEKGQLVMPAGVPKGYFGPLTRAALARYQASVGIAPAVGYFGPITRAHLAYNPSPNPSPNPDDDDDDLSGGEGDIRDFDVLGNPGNETVDEGDTEEVFGFEFEAEDSDLRVERLEMLASTTDTGTDRPWEVIESARLYMDGDEVAEVSDLDDEDSWNEEDDDVYSFRFDDIDEIVREGDTARFIVEFTAVNNIDSADDPTEIELSIADDGLRVVDAEGINIYEGDEDDTRTVTFGEAEGGDLDLSIDEDDNEDRTVFVDEDSDTDGVEIMRFTIEANASDNFIDELQVQLTALGTTTQLSQVISNLTLEVDGDEIASESVPSGSSPVTVTFDDLEDDFVIDEDDEVEVVIFADIVEQEGNYGQGYRFEASVAGSGIEAEDGNGDDVTLSGSVTGGEIELRTEGLNVEFLESNTTRNNGQNPGEADTVTMTIDFEVTANGEDVWIDGDTIATTSPTSHSSTDGVAWASSSDSVGMSTTTAVTAIVTPDDGYRSADVNTSGDKRLVIRDGNTRQFRLTVTMAAGQDNAIAGIELTGIKWDANPSGDTGFDNLYDFDLGEFRTGIVTGLNIR